MNPTEIIQEVARQVSVCERCNLYHSRKRAVPGEGPADARIMLIGEGPGFYENEQGRPFVGQAGKFLDELLQNARLSRREVFITNVVKCRPPGNRDPLPEELLACGDYLERQIEAIDPDVIITLGRHSMGRFMPAARISAVHGQASWYHGRLVIAMYHPAAALHQPSLKPVVIADFSRVPEFLAQYESQLKARHENQAANAPAHQIVEVTPPSPMAAARPLSLFDMAAPAEPPPADASAPADQAEDTPRQLSLF